MPDYDLHSFLGWRSFEQLIQALAVKVLGGATIVFGDGPDGGREATYHGRTAYPTAEQPWDGYIIVQAKFRQRSAPDDARWALAQLASELENFARQDRTFPKFYIFATNVVLPPRESGAKDEAYARVDEAVERLRIVDYAIWDYDQIRTFLDVHTDVRQTYAAWTTPGDVLAAAVEHLRFSVPDFDRVLSNFLEKQLLADQYANLETAGYKAEERVLLNRVFVDLPVAQEMYVHPPTDVEERRVTSLIGTLVETGDERLDARGGYRSIRGRAPSPPPGRFILLGGPGQGKSTAGQYISQLYRVALLRERPKGVASIEAARLIEEIVEQTADVPAPRVRRFPVRIVLSELADFLGDARNRKKTLVAYIASLLDEASSCNVGPDDLRRWLGQYPWLLVLDGLDEVPVSANRQTVLQKIQEFWVDAGGENADILVVATCRPQGYNEDFSPQSYKHLWLVPLTPQRALAYATKLVSTRFRGERSRTTRILDAIARAANEETTARLMRTPLQVTIMAVLIDQGGEPPHERWKLFRQYYNVMYARETQKPLASADILRNYQPDIDAIHHRTALILQILAERTGNTEAQLSPAVFSEIVERRLAEEEHRGQALERLRDSIVAAACERLVFLVGLKEERIGFEIRSLQEYMAAEALMDGTQAAVTARLQHIATVPSWRNVFLFAAGSCFAVAERQHLRPMIYTIVGELNEDTRDAVARLGRTGAMVAADILDDGSARHQPRSVRAIAQIALRMLELPAGQDQLRLARLYAETIDEVFREHVLRASHSARAAERRSGWLILLELSATGVDWAKDAARQYWPAELARQLEIVSAIGTETPVSLARCRTLLPSLPLEYELLDQFLHDRRRNPLASVRRLMRIKVRGLAAEALFDFRITPVVPSPAAIALMDEISTLEPKWRFPRAVSYFLRDPSAVTLADALDSMAAGLGAEDSRFVLDLAPWPLAACFAAAHDLPAEMGKIAECARRGDFGSTDDWLHAESQWRLHGVGLEDLVGRDRDIAFRANAALGFPCAVADLEEFTLPQEPSVAMIAASVGQVKSHLLRRCLSRILVHWAAIAIDSERTLSVLTQTLHEYPDLIPIAAEILHDTGRTDESWLEAWNAIGSIDRLGIVARWPSRSLQVLQNAVQKDPSRTGLLWITTRAAMQTGKPSILPPLHAKPHDAKALLVRELLQEGTGALPPADSASMKELVADPLLLEELIDALARRAGDSRAVHAVTELVTAYCHGAPSETVLRMLKDVLHSRSSGFADPIVWKRLDFPPTLRGVIDDV